MVVDQGDVDGKFPVAIDELPGTVERVDEPVALPLAANGKVGQALFLGNDGDVRCQFGETGHDGLLSREIGLCQRRFVVLALNVEVGRVDFQDLLAGLRGKRGDRLDQFSVIHGFVP